MPIFNEGSSVNIKENMMDNFGFLEFFLALPLFGCILGESQRIKREGMESFILTVKSNLCKGPSLLKPNTNENTNTYIEPKSTLFYIYLTISFLNIIANQQQDELCFKC